MASRPYPLGSFLDQVVYYLKMIHMKLGGGRGGSLITLVVIYSHTRCDTWYFLQVWSISGGGSKLEKS